jgi:hypothetical protein
VLKRTITYEDFNGVQQTEDFYFHLSQAELVEMEAAQRGGLGNYLTRIIETNDGAAIINEFKRLIDLSIGKVSDDGKRFIKDEEIKRDFRESPAYSVLFMELATNAEKSAEFVTGIIPKGVEKDVAKIGATADEPQRERNEAERPSRDKVMTQAEADVMDQDRLIQRIKNGWTIEG